MSEGRKVDEKEGGAYLPPPPFLSPPSKRERERQREKIVIFVPSKKYKNLHVRYRKS